jgi:subtilisin family serine protease
MPTPSTAPLRVVFAGRPTDAGRLYLAALAAQGRSVSIVAAVTGGADVRELPGVPAFASLTLVALNLIDVDLVVIAGHHDAASIVEQAGDRRWNVLCATAFTDDLDVAARAYVRAVGDRRMLMLGHADRFMVGGALAGTPGERGAGVRTITARRVMPTAAGAEPPSQEQLLLGAEGVARLARALYVLDQGGDATVAAPRPLPGRPTTAIVELHGVRLTIEVDHGPGHELPSERLEVEGPSGRASLILPVDSGRLVFDEPPSTATSTGGPRQVLQLPTIERCHELVVAEALRQVRAGGRRASGDDIRLLYVLDAIRQSLARDGALVDVTLP